MIVFETKHTSLLVPDSRWYEVGNYHSFPPLLILQELTSSLKKKLIKQNLSISARVEQWHSCSNGIIKKKNWTIKAFESCIYKSTKITSRYFNRLHSEVSRTVFKFILLFSSDYIFPISRNKAKQSPQRHKDDLEAYLPVVKPQAN